MDEQKDPGYTKIDITEMFHGVFRSFRHLLKYGLVLTLLLGAVTCFRAWRSYRPVYEASASLTVKVTNPFYGSQSYYNSAVAKQMAATFPHILSSSALNQKVMDRLDIPYMPSVSVRVQGNTNIVSLTVRDRDPQLCYEVLQCVMEVYPSVAEFVVGPTTMKLMNDSGVPQEPVNRISYPQAAMKGMVLGLALWAAFSGVYWLTHRTVNNEEQLGRLVNLECLGKVPLVRGYGRNQKEYSCPLVSRGMDKFGFGESIRLLRVRVVRQMAKYKSQVLLVTSTIANEGKTTISLNLALSLAQREKRVLLIDCDLRNPSVGKSLGLKEELGLSDLLRGKCRLEAVLHHDDDFLYTIYGGAPTGRPERLLGSKNMKDLISAARQSFDYIILDTPPCALMGDTAEVFSLADCALLSVRQDFACRQQILEGVQVLGDIRKPIIGCVLNMSVARLRAKSYGYGYGYGYGTYGAYGRKEPDHKNQTE